MSRGPGRVQSAIMRELADKPFCAFTSRELVVIAFPGIERPRPTHYASVHRVITRHALPEGWARHSGWSGRHTVIFNTASEASKADAEQIARNLRSKKDWLHHDGE